MAKSQFKRKTEKTFTQATKTGLKNVLKIREAFPTLPTQKVIEMHDAAFETPSPKQPFKVSMTTKGPSRKHVLVPIAEENRGTILQTADIHVNALNRQLKNVKSDITIDYICPSWNGIILTTNKVARASNLMVLEKYLKNLENINHDDNLVPCLPQSKSYLKILGVLYYGNNASNPISAIQVEEILSYNTMFSDITLAAYPRVVRASPSSDMAIIWVDIWDSQNGTKAKSIINRCLNFGQHIATIRGTNMNLGVPQCRNCWK